jgi:uncharacterized membrane protein
VSGAAATAVAGVLILATTVWIGGFVTLVVVTRVARATLGPAGQVAFFRGLGRAYGAVSGIALAVGLATGAALVYGRAWDGVLAAAVAVAAALVLATGVGVVQARRMTRLRRRLAEDPDDGTLSSRVRRGGRSAALLRGLIGALSLALLALGVALAG